MALGNKKRRASSVFFVFLIAIFLLFGIFSRMIDSRLSLTEIPDSAKAATPFFQVVVLEMKDTALPSTVSGLKTLRASVYSSIDDTHLSSLNFYLKNTDTGGVSGIGATASGSLDPTTSTEDWTADINTIGFPDGNYQFYATGFYNGSAVDSQQKYSFIIYNGPLDTIGISVKFVNPPAFPVSGNQDIYISTNPAADSVTFQVSSTEFTGVPSAQLPNTNYVYKFTWKTADFPNGDYTVTANVQKGTTKNSATLSLSVDNGSATPNPTLAPTPTPDITPEITPVPTPTIPVWIPPAPTPDTRTNPTPKISLEPTPDIPASSATPSPEADNRPDSQLLLECREKGITSVEDCRRYLLVPLQCGQQNILDLDKCKEYLFKQAMPADCLNQNTSTQSQCASIIFSGVMPDDCRKANLNDPAKCADLLIGQAVLSDDCKNQGIDSAEGCGYATREKYETLENKIMGQDASKECQDMNIEGKDECVKTLFGKYAPEECDKAGVYDLGQCEKTVFNKYAPVDCAEKGILDPEFCKNYIFEKYDKLNDIPLEKLPIECRKSGAASAKDCDRLMKEKYLPEKCEDRGLEDPDQCSFYLERDLSQDCHDVDAKTSGECGGLLLKKNSDRECKYIGINDGKECNDFLFNMYASKVTCTASDGWQCDNIVKSNYLGNIVAGQISFDKVNREIAPLVGKFAKADDLSEMMGGNAWMVPVKESDTDLKIEPLENKMAVDSEGDFMQTAPAALVIDSDRDGLPDDMEKRLGTDPLKADTNGNGYKDGEEIKNGYDPIASGKLSDDLKAKISAVDQAILDGKTLGDARISGLESDGLAVSEAANADKKGYTFSGKAKKNSTVTIYVYSGFPLILTVKADENGDWKYELDKTLADGGHDVYAVLNDDSGNVVGKSKPLSFFVKDGKEVALKDYIVSQLAVKPSESAKAPVNYLIVFEAAIAVVVIVFVIWLIRWFIGRRIRQI